MTVTSANGTRDYLFICIFVAALLIRLVIMPFAGNEGDMKNYDYWIDLIQQHGLLEFYSPEFHPELWDRTYPPLSTAVFWALSPLRSNFVATFDPFRDHVWVFFIKLFPVICELALIVVAYIWLRSYGRLRYVIPAILAVLPGIVATTAWWGQYDSVLTLFLVLALIALNRDRINLAWLMAGIGILFKLHTIVLLPLLFILSLKRYGVRKTAIGIGIMAGLVSLIFLPFVLAEGLEVGLSSYLTVTGSGPFANVTNAAFNFWHIVASLHKGSAFRFGDVGYGDEQAVFATLTLHQIGLLMMGAFTLLFMFAVWKHAHERKEFVWGAAIYLAFFVLPTRVHERYLFPATVLSVLAISQDRRMLWLALGLAVTYSYNIFQVMLSHLQPTLNLWPDVLALAVAAVNCILLAMIAWFIFNPKPSAKSDTVVLEAVTSSP